MHISLHESVGQFSRAPGPFHSAFYFSTVVYVHGLGGGGSCTVVLLWRKFVESVLSSFPWVLGIGGKLGGGGPQLLRKPVLAWL